MGMPIRKNKSAAYSTVGPVWVITALSGPYRWSLCDAPILGCLVDNLSSRGIFVDIG